MSARPRTAKRPAPSVHARVIARAGALVGVAALALTVGGSLARWADRAAGPAPAATSGHLDIAVAEPAWYLIDEQTGLGTPVDPATFILAPGDQMAHVTHWTLAQAGANMLGQVRFGADDTGDHLPDRPVAVTGDPALLAVIDTASLTLHPGHVDPASTRLDTSEPLSAAVVDPQGAGSTFLAPLPQTSGTRLVSTVVAVAIAADAAFEDIEDSVLDVANLTAHLAQTRTGATP